MPAIYRNVSMNRGDGFHGIDKNSKWRTLYLWLCKELTIVWVVKIKHTFTRTTGKSKHCFKQAKCDNKLGKKLEYEKKLTREMLKQIEIIFFRYLWKTISQSEHWSDRQSA